MRRTFVALAGLAGLCSVAGLGGCYADAYVEPTPVYQTTYADVPYDNPTPVTVSMAPPPPRYETIITCGYGTSWVPGRWDYRGNWAWARGYCAQSRPGYVYVAPRYTGGVYYRAYWSPSGGSTYMAPPAAGVVVAPGYGRPGYAQPAPAYQPAPPPRYGGGGTYVAPPVAGSTYQPPPPSHYGGGGTYVAPPAAGSTYQPPPPSHYGGGTYVAPPAAGSTYQPAPPPRGGNYVTPPAPGSTAYQPAQPYRPAPSGQPPAYRPAQPTGQPPAYHPAQPPRPQGQPASGNPSFGAPPPRHQPNP